jgi:phosphinothricin acetyltransferase
MGRVDIWRGAGWSRDWNGTSSVGPLWSPVSRRPVYRGVAEVSIYVAESARGRGIGARLMAELIADSEAEGIWTLQAGIFPENTASIELHTKTGFRVVGTRSRLGSMNGRWRDVVLLERRSLTVGT